MKGHVGGGSGFWRLLGVGYSVKVKPFHGMLAHAGISNMSYTFPYVKNLCRNGS
jgi:hypothetical protein